MELIIVCIIAGCVTMWSVLRCNKKVAEKEIEIARLQSQLEAKANGEAIKKEMNSEFELIANRLFRTHQEDMRRNNVEQLSSVLTPFSTNLQQLKERVEHVYDADVKGRAGLAEQLRILNQLNTKLSEEANNLTKALTTNNKTQGNWGEMILESILEGSGLREGEHYFVQSLLKDKYGDALINQETKRKMQPDVIVRYPGERDIIIDSKVSLVDYMAAIAAEEESEKRKALVAHLRSVRAHIDELSVKDYSQYDVASLDFVMLFIPNEGAYLAAIQQDANLWQYAYDKKVVLMSPTNLISALRLSLDLWKKEDQRRGIEEIISRATKIYDKVVNFSDSFLKMGERISQAEKEYQTAMKQLSTGNGSLLSQVEKLKDMGLSPKKEISRKFTDNEDESNTLEMY